MALTRAMLKGMSLTDEQVSAIIEEHTATVDGLKKQRDEYKADAEELPTVKKELEDLKKDVASKDFDEWKKKYEDEHADFEKYKADVLEKETAGKIRDAYKKLLAECKVGEKHVDSILRVTKFDDMKLAEDGTLEGVEDIKKQINADWSGFIVSEGTKGSDVDNPPAGSGGDDGGTHSRAAELAAKYHENLYGKKED